jgi:16S rRNA (guanine966-N2)-methyltransferase
MARNRAAQLEFTVIAGDLRGRKIRVPDLGVTRPPLTRLRRAIFDFLDPYLTGAAYLDLFSGTGSYLFEAVSRGAEKAFGVEQEPQLAAAINKQADELGIADRLTCLGADVFQAIPSLAASGNSYDVIMIAPPQYRGLVDLTLTFLRRHPVFSEETLLLCQHDSIETTRIDFSAFPIRQQRRYGNTTFTVLGGG